MKIAVAILLGLLATWSFSAIVRQFAWRSSWGAKRKTKNVFPAGSLYRDLFHFVVCLALLILLIQNQISPVIISIMTAVLLLGFEYALVFTRKRRR